MMERRVAIAIIMLLIGAALIVASIVEEEKAPVESVYWSVWEETEPAPEPSPDIPGGAIVGGLFLVVGIIVLLASGKKDKIAK